MAVAWPDSRLKTEKEAHHAADRAEQAEQRCHRDDDTEVVEALAHFSERDADWISM